MPSSVVRRKAQEADEMIARLAAEANGEDPNAQQQTSGDENDGTLEADPAESQPHLQSVNTDDQGYEGDDGAATSTQEDSPGEVAELKRQLEKADQRWRSLQGQISSRDQQIEQLHQLLARMDQAPAPQQPQNQNTSQQPSGISKDDIDAYGEDMIDLVKRVAGDVTSNNVAQLQEQVRQLQAQLGEVKEVSTKVASVGFDDALTKEFPAWKELNEDVGFIGWLEDSEARLKQFGDAVKRQDAADVAEYFQRYADKTGWKGKTAGKQRKQEELSRQVAPGKGRSGGAHNAQSQPDQDMWTRSRIAALYANKSQYAADEFAKLERQAAKAMQENRVDYSK